VTRAADGPMRAFFATPEVSALRSAGQFEITTRYSAYATNAVINGMTLGGLSIDAVDGSFFRVVGVPVTAGRPITEADVRDALPVAVVSHAVANSRYAGD